MPKKRTKAEKSSPEEKAVNQVLRQLGAEIGDFEKKWTEAISTTRGKIKLIFMLFEVSEELRKIREELRVKLSPKVFEEKNVANRLKDFSCRVKKIRGSIPPLVIDAEGKILN